MEIDQFWLLKRNFERITQVYNSKTSDGKEGKANDDYGRTYHNVADNPTDNPRAFLSIGTTIG